MPTEFDNPTFQGNFDNTVFQGGVGTTPTPHAPVGFDNPNFQGTFDYAPFQGNPAVTVSPETTYAGIAAWVQDRLIKSPTELPASAILLDIQSVLNRLLLYYPCLPVYGAITGVDKLFFDEAVGLMVAARRRVFNPKESAVNELTRYTNGPVTFQYQQPRQGLSIGKTGAPPPTLEERWIEDAYMALRMVSCVAAFYKQFQDGFQVFALAGRRRAAMQLGLLHSHCYGWGNPILPLMFCSDQFILELVDESGKQ